MLLAIDCGNTNIVFALYEGGISVGEWRIETKQGRTADEYTAWLSHLLSLQSLTLTTITDVIIASVVPVITDHLARFSQHNLSLSPMIVGEPSVKLGVSVDIDMPSQVGADRLVNAHAAAQIGKLPAIILDFGTATTFDLIKKGNSYAGGVIAPGIHLSANALSQAAARLPEIDIVPFGADMPIIGRDTKAAMRSGIFWGYVAMIDGVIARISAQEGDDLTVIATGGLAHLFAPHIKAISAVDSHLTMRGLVQIHSYNKG
ncbi:MAG: type III pantothenate kinase [Candidatus Puniceispirillaceae bacterium]